MSFFSITAVTLLIALLIVFAVTVVTYMSSLVKNAYQLKVELRTDLDDGLRKLDEETEKRSRALKRDLLDEAAKVRNSIESETARRVNELTDAMRKDLAELQDVVKKDRARVAQGFEEVRRRVSDVEQVYRNLKRSREPGTPAQGNGG